MYRNTTNKMQNNHNITGQIRLIFIGVLLLFFIANTSAQTRNDLESQRSQLNQQIKKANQQLQKTQSTRKTTAKQISGLQKKLKGREEIIKSLSEVVADINANIYRKEQIVNALKEDLGKLKSAYHQLLRLLYRYKIQQKPVLFFLSASHFTEMQQRWQFLRRLEDKQFQQMHLISKTQASLNRNLEYLNTEKAKKDAILSGEMKEKSVLAQDLKSKDKQLTSLQQKEKQLHKDLTAKEKAKQQLNSKIESVIRNVIAEQKQGAFSYQSSAGAKTTTYTTSTADKNVGGSFATRKGKLPAPASGTLVSGFGKTVHPQFPEVFIMNNGIDIQTKANATVQAVHEGIVVSTFAVPGNGNAVMVRHGDYYTTYSNLSSVSVKRGDKVSAKAKLGAVGKDTATGKYILHFELWKGKAKENPSAWIGG